MTDSMKTRMNTVWAGLSLLAVLVSCQKNTPAERNARAIRFSVPSVQTRATDSAPEQDIFQVRDYYNGGIHLSNTLAYDQGKKDWVYGSPYASGEEPQWATGTHKLFGWLGSDGEDAAYWFGGTPLSLSGTQLSIPAKTLDNATWQMDFLYSDVVTRSTSEPGFDAEVPLVFNHLFSRVALSFRVKELSPGETFNLKQVYLDGGFRNRNSATIDFSSAGTPEVSYGTPEAADHPFIIRQNQNQDLDLSYNTPSSVKAFDILAQTESPSPSFYLMWPLDEEYLTGSSNDFIVVEYTVSNGGVESGRKISRMAFPKGTSWKPGCSYRYAVEYMSGIIRVEETVLHWNMDTYWNVGEEVAAVASWMGWNTLSYDFENTAGLPDYNDEFDVIFKRTDSGFKPIHGFFKIDSPKDCTFTIELEGADKDYFIFNEPNYGSDPHTGFGRIVPELDPDNDIDREHGYYRAGETIDLWLAVDPSYSSGQKSVKTSFSVTVDDGVTPPRKISLDSEMQRYGKFNIIIPSSN